MPLIKASEDTQGAYPACVYRSITLSMGSLLREIREAALEGVPTFFREPFKLVTELRDTNMPERKIFNS